MIDIIDSDDEPNITQNPVPDRQGSESISVSTCFAADGKEPFFVVRLFGLKCQLFSFPAW